MNVFYLNSGFLPCNAQYVTAVGRGAKCNSSVVNSIPVNFDIN